MTEMFRCGDGPALTAFLYDECEPLEREVIAAHVAACPACAAEIEELAAARRQLASWAPPEARLGFRVTREDADTVVDARSAFAARGANGAGDVIATMPWWRRPMPAWAQVAAAAVIFATGIGVGTTQQAAPAAPLTDAMQSSMRTDMARVSARLDRFERAQQAQPSGIMDASAIRQMVRAEIAAAQTSSTGLREVTERTVAAPLAGNRSAFASSLTPYQGNAVVWTGAGSPLVPIGANGFAASGVARTDEPVSVRRVQAMISGSEQALRSEIAMLLVELLNDMDEQRRFDREQVNRDLDSAVKPLLIANTSTR